MDAACGRGRGLALLKATRILCILLTAAGAVLSAGGRLVFPFSHMWMLFAAAGIAVTIHLVWINMGRTRPGTVKILLLSALFCGVVIAWIVFLRNPGRRFVYRSPGGQNCIVVRYDGRSVPSLYRMHAGIFQTRVPLDTIPGFMETVTFQVVWHSEDRLKLDLGLYKGRYEKYEVDLSTGRSTYFRVLPESLRDLDEW